MKRLALTAAGILAFATAASAQTATPPTEPSTPPTAAQAQKAEKISTQDFVNTVANINMYEIQAAKAAQGQSKDDDIKNFAQLMLDDHNKMSDELQNKVQNIKGMQVPSEMTKDFKDKVQTLKSAKGHQFEQEYRKQMIQSHKEAINLFQTYAQTGDNNDLKNWARDSVATLQKHLNRAESLPKTTAGL